jgi:hypothetical protein
VRPSASVVEFDKDGVYPPLLERKSSRAGAQLALAEGLRPARATLS